MTKFYGEKSMMNNLSVMDREAGEIDLIIKSNNEWTEIGIGLCVDKSNLFLLDCNAVVCIVYKRESTDEKWYCGDDTLGVACIRTADGLKEFISEFNNGVYTTV